MKFKINLTQTIQIIIALVLAILTAYLDNNMLNQAASAISQMFVNLFKLIGTLILFLSISCVFLGMDNLAEFKKIGKKLIKYTLLTTYTAAVVALILYLLLNPTSTVPTTHSLATEAYNKKEYLAYFIQIIPDNIITPFYENHIISVLFLAILFGFASLKLPSEQRLVLHSLFSSFHGLITSVVSWIIQVFPVAIWSFIVHLLKNMRENLSIRQVGLYLLTVVAANLIQGIIVLPVFAKIKGVSPVKLAHHMLPALLLAFFSKSSNVALPMTMQCAEEKGKIPKKLANLAFPLCTTINMNGCAAFILITVLFVCMNQGIQFSILEMIGWTFIATMGAVGNAGVPMGCYFLSSSLLAAMNVPLDMLVVILPFYSIIDMLETAVNVWSDSCVVSIVNQELKNTNVLL